MKTSNLLVKRFSPSAFYKLMFILLFFSSCTANRFLKDGEQFYNGASIKIKSKESKSGKEQKAARSIAEEQLTQKTNDKILGMRPLVWMYMRVDTTEKLRVVARWMKRKFGREPILYQSKIPEQTAGVIENKLFNNGFFNATVDYKVKESKHKVELVFYVAPSRRFYMDSIFVIENKDSIFTKICEKDDNSLLKNGDPYVLDVLKEERLRISKEMKNEGFYYFSSDYLSFKVDSTLGDHKLMVGLALKTTAPEKSRIAYTISEVNVYPNYVLDGDSTLKNQPRIKVNDINFIGSQGYFDYDFLSEAIFLKKGELYTSRYHDLTIKRLSSLGVFKFIDVRFEESDSIENGLIANIYLTRLLPQSVRVEVGVTSKSNNFVGPGLDLNYSHKNLFKGAEHLTLGLGGAFETQFGSNSKGVNSTEINFSSLLSVPRLWSPVNFGFSKDQELPKTELRIDYTFLNRTRFYTLYNSKADFGYRWDRNVHHHHQITLLSVNYTRATNISKTFQDFLNQNPELNRTFKEQLIIAARYNYQFYSKPPSTKKHYWYFNPSLEMAGNVTNSISKWIKPDVQGQREVLGITFSQFVKTDVDLRYYQPLGKERKLVFRFLGGVGIAYGNSTTLPYLKQYFIGGSNSIRAFQARSLGPGTYKSERINGLLIDQSGDLKLEANFEYRAKIYRFIKGVLFLDAGNIWLLRENDLRPGGEFHVDSFLSQVAVGAGAGIRLDFNYFVFRTDLALPIVNPSLSEQPDFTAKWAFENLVLNVGIGYPF